MQGLYKIRSTYGSKFALENTYEKLPFFLPQNRCIFEIPPKVVFFEIFLNWFKCTNYTLSDMIFFALLGTVIKCQKGTASAWEKNTTQSCVFLQAIYLQCL